MPEVDMKHLLAVLIASAIGLAAVTAAQAKGPLDAEVSGNGLDSPVRISGPYEGDDIYPLTAQAVDRQLLAGESPYTVAFFTKHPDTGEEVRVFAIEYYPATDLHPAAFNDRDGQFMPSELPWEASAAISDKLDAAIAAQGQASNGADDGFPYWVLVPGMLAGLVLAGAGGGYWLRRGSR
jgi:hypothetical protein